MIAFDKKTFDPFYAAVENTIKNNKCLNAESLYSFFACSDIAKEYEEALKIAEKLADSRRTKEWIASKILEDDELVLREMKINSLGGVDSSSKTALRVSDARFS